MSPALSFLALISTSLYGVWKPRPVGTVDLLSACYSSSILRGHRPSYQTLPMLNLLSCLLNAWQMEGQNSDWSEEFSLPLLYCKTSHGFPLTVFRMSRLNVSSHSEIFSGGWLITFRKYLTVLFHLQISEGGLQMSCLHWPVFLLVLISS